MQGKPTILLATTCRWFSAARLCLSFTRAGFAVEAVCPANHPLKLTHAARSIYNFDPFAPGLSIKDAIEKSRPDLVIPCDDLAAIHLRRLYGNAIAYPASDSAYLIELISRSLGDAASFPVLASRNNFLAVAREEGIETPETTEINTAEQVQSWCRAYGFPAVLKADGTSGGRGVRVVQSLEEAYAAFRSLSAPVAPIFLIKRAAIDRDLSLLGSWVKRRRYAVTIQRFVPGVDYNIAVACWKGEVIASFGAQVLETWRPKGPASVIRLVPGGTMLEIAQQLVRRLQLSGLCGFDFLVDAKTGQHTLIEINPRATQTGHIPFGAGHDLAAALFSAVTGEACEPLCVTTNEEIALFPLAWQSSPPSVHRDAAFHDIPWEAPALVRAGEAETSLLTHPKWRQWIELWLRAWIPSLAVRLTRVGAGALVVARKEPA